LFNYIKLRTTTLILSTQAAKYLSGAFIFAVFVAALMLRYEYQRAGTVRINRFTGSREEFRELNSGAWIWTVDCFQAQHAK
jgi:hypothetical protein